MATLCSDFISCRRLHSASSPLAYSSGRIATKRCGVMAPESVRSFSVAFLGSRRLKSNERHLIAYSFEFSKSLNISASMAVAMAAFPRASERLLRALPRLFSVSFAGSFGSLGSFCSFSFSFLSLKYKH